MATPVTGFVIDADGYILTNEHVIGEAETVWVTTDDRKVYPAIVVGSDPRADLAVLKIPGANFPIVKFARCGSVEPRVDMEGGWIVIGGLAGAIAKLLMPGRDPGGCIVTVILGIAGALIAGWLGYHATDGLLALVTAIAGQSDFDVPRSELGHDEGWNGRAVAKRLVIDRRQAVEEFKGIGIDRSYMMIGAVTAGDDPRIPLGNEERDADATGKSAAPFVQKRAHVSADAPVIAHEVPSVDAHRNHSECAFGTGMRGPLGFLQLRARRGRCS